MKSMKHLAMVLAVAATAIIANGDARAEAARATGSAITVPVIDHPDGETPQWWFRYGASQADASRAGVSGRPRNVILFIGDGMSLSTIDAARILQGQRNGQSGEENRLSFERFPHTGLARTYNTDAQTPDSAGTMSAMMTGVKTRMGLISVDQRAGRGDCAASQGRERLTAFELAEAAGLATGVVTTTRITHATPAATYGHSPERNWETDGDIPQKERALGCRDLALQLLEFAHGDGLDIVLGGGRLAFMPAGEEDVRDPRMLGTRLDGRDLTREWAARPGSVYIHEASQLADLDPRRARHVLGLFSPDHMQFDHERRLDPKDEPSLSEMTRAAIQFLQKAGADKPGYLLMVEGGRIDHAHHFGNAYRALDDTIALSDAVETAVRLTSADDTLIIVTSDHGHTMTIGGYPVRGNPILGLVRGSSGEGTMKPDLTFDMLGRPYTTLNYQNGPGYAGESNQQPEGPKRHEHRLLSVQPATDRPNLYAVATEDADYLQESLIPLSSETHSGEDVVVFAQGVGASAVRGSFEQNAIFHIIANALEPLRERLCQLGSCNAAGVPEHLPETAVAPAR